MTGEATQDVPLIDRLESGEPGEKGLPEQPSAPGSIGDLRDRDATGTALQGATTAAMKKYYNRPVADTDPQGRTNSQAKENDAAEARHAALRAQMQERPFLKRVLHSLSDIVHGRLFTDDLHARSKHMWQGDPPPTRQVVPPALERPTKG